MEYMGLPEILQYTKLSIATIYRYMATKNFPVPTKIGGRIYQKKDTVDIWFNGQFIKGDNNE